MKTLDLEKFKPLETAMRRGPTASWYDIRNSEDVTELFILEEIGGFGVSATTLIKDLQEVNSPKIVVHLNSGGGDAFDGVAIFNTLVKLDAKVEMRVVGEALSAASVIAMAGDEIIMETASRMMIHDGQIGIFGSPATLRETAEILDAMSQDVAGIYALRAGGTSAEWRALMKETTFFSAEEAVAAGLADRVDDAPKRIKNVSPKTTMDSAKLETEVFDVDSLADAFLTNSVEEPKVLDVNAMQQAFKEAINE